MNDAPADIDRESPAPWIAHALLAAAFCGDVPVQHVVYAATGVLLRLGAIKIVALAFLVVWIAALGPRRRREDPLLLLMMAAVAAYALIGVDLALFRTGAINNYVVFKAANVVFQGAVGMWALSRVVATRADLRRFALALGAGAAWIACVNGFEALVGNVALLLSATRESYEYGVIGALGLPLIRSQDAGYRLAPLVLLPFALRSRGAWSAAFRYAAPALLAALVFLSGHRSALVGMVLAYGYRVVTLRRFGEALAAAVVVALAVGAAQTYKGEAAAAVERATTLLSVTSTVGDRSLRERGAMWSAAREIVEEHPVLGVGFGEFGRALGRPSGSRAYPHNVVLEYAVDAGLAGLAILAFLALSALSTFAGARDEWAAAFVGMVIVCFFLAGLSGDFVYNRNLYMLLGLVPLWRRTGARDPNAGTGLALSAPNPAACVETP